VTVTLEQDGHTAVGRGSHTDIILASVKAYLDALNRLEQRLSAARLTSKQV
jgi:2-isopropylmalate synthase